MLYTIHYINTNEILDHITKSIERCDFICNHSNSDLFTCENNMLSSCVKISCFHAKAHLLFHWCLYNKKGFWVAIIPFCWSTKNESSSYSRKISTLIIIIIVALIINLSALMSVGFNEVKNNCLDIPSCTHLSSLYILVPLTSVEPRFKITN